MIEEQLTILNNKRVILGVTGSIACYKTADLASKLRQAGALVDVILSEAATKFIAPITFQSVTSRRAYIDADMWSSEGHVLHIGLSQAADLLVIAPITANTLAKLATGQADTLLTVTALAAMCPMLLAPAMDGGMLHHPATQANIKILEQRGAIIVGPAMGHLASGLRTAGRMIEPTELLGHIRQTLAQHGPLHSKRVLVTAGGTREAIDPVRYITNRSSGKQGYALAQAALDLGARVTLISTPVALPIPVGVQHIEVLSAKEMLDTVVSEVASSDVLLMAAAVSDFRPAEIAKHKIKKENEAPTLQLTRTPDILQAVALQRESSTHPRIVVGFAAESQDLLQNAQKKLKAKKLDLIVANDIKAQDAGFGVNTNRVTIMLPDTQPQELPLMTKYEVAKEILGYVVKLLEK
jgi:phosphopantothenoylcysteine decarboxylase/phosphopantothenate--cysteine ligase